jgi:hypothetical protein
MYAFSIALAVNKKRTELKQVGQSDFISQARECGGFVNLHVQA